MFKKVIVLYASQLYRAAFPLLLVPLIIGMLGTERYGLVSFFTMLIMLMGLLDAGISGTFIKLIATNKNQLVNFTRVVNLFLKVFCGFVVVAGILVFIFNNYADYIANDWLKTNLSNDETIICIKLTGVILALLYLRSYLQSFVNGMERQDLIAIWSMFYTTFFYGGSYLVLVYYSNTLIAFFTSLLALAIVDIIATAGGVAYVIMMQRKSLNEYHDNNDQAVHEIISFRSVIKFSLQLSGLSMIWVIASQVDKISLSTYTDLTSYTHYQIGAQLSTVVLTLAAPLSQLLLPRMSALVKEKNHTKFVELFSLSSIGYIVCLAPLVPYMYLYGGDLISLWLKNRELGFTVNEYAKWLVSAAFFAGMMNFVFILLYSTGQLKFHFYAYALYSALTIPLTVLIAKYFGPHWSCIFYFIQTIMFMLLWGGYCVHKEMTGYVRIIPLLTMLILMVSYVVFKITQSYELFSGNKFLYILCPPIINLVIICGFIYMFKNQLLTAIHNFKIKKW